LGNIVNEFDWVGVDSVPFLHNTRSNNNEQYINKCNQECRCRVRQKPSL
jgi:hypothetical protein